MNSVNEALIRDIVGEVLGRLGGAAVTKAPAPAPAPAAKADCGCGGKSGSTPIRFSERTSATRETRSSPLSSKLINPRSKR